MQRRTFLKDAATVALGTAIGDGALAAPPPDRSPRTGSPRQRLSLDQGWRFHLGDIEVPGPRVDNETYDYTKAGNAAGAAATDYDDTLWPLVDVPHDFVIEQPYVKEENNAQGYRPKDVGWYRRTLRFDPADRGRHLELQLDGLATTATVWFNGNVVANILSGYSSTYIDLTPFALFGDEPNILAIRVDSRALQGWWYEGGGLYRHTWLVKRAPVHIVTDGISAHPRPAGEAWRIPVEATLENIGEGSADARVDAILFDADDRPLGKATATVAVPSLARAEARLSIDIASPRLWSIEQPTLHRVEVTVSQNGMVTDRESVAVGFRTQRFDADHGFFLNGQPVKLKGTCNHQDHAGLGVALPDSIIEFRLRRLKEMGCNAIRASHNAQTRELLDAADRLGLLVMNENRL
ncbi:sugar-binding domain-containing protein, partial [Sphingomonas bacterium]|uniref:sugar-binding domain-containing protein n=1 Tax=Sphingomonas bacterium TaxID=1895847 RepID=UPI00266FF031